MLQATVCCYTPLRERVQAIGCKTARHCVLATGHCERGYSPLHERLQGTVYQITRHCVLDYTSQVFVREATGHSVSDYRPLCVRSLVTMRDATGHCL